MTEKIPFVGFVSTRPEHGNEPGMMSYCLRVYGEGLTATNDIGGLGAMVVQEFGSDYQNKVTYIAPEDEIVGREGYRQIRSYTALSDNLRDELLKAANNWISRI